MPHSMVSRVVLRGVCPHLLGKEPTALVLRHTFLSKEAPAGGQCLVLVLKASIVGAVLLTKVMLRAGEGK